MVTIRNSVTEKVKGYIDGALQEGLKWVRSKYPTVNFDNVDFIFSAGYNRSRYFNNENNLRYPNPTACICTRAKLMLYEKKSLEIKNYDIHVGCYVQIVCAVIHELTHHAQRQTGIRIGNELDTTANEVAYLKEFHPNHYAKLIN